MSIVSRFLFKVLLWFFTVSLFFVVIYKFVPVPFTPLMVIRAIENSAEEERKLIQPRLGVY
jgi:monofunctional biosynthetic peptidoglycan transglycosylase